LEVVVKKHFYLKSALLIALSLLVTGCTSSPNSNQDSKTGIGPNDVSLLNSTLSFQCSDKNEYFYSVYFGISVKNNSDQTITNEDIKFLKLEAGLFNVNGMGRLETKEFLVSQNGIEPGGTGLLAFYLAPSIGIEWRSLDISIDGTKVYDQPISVSESLCP
jgi:hypothetical protein